MNAVLGALVLVVLMVLVVLILWIWDRLRLVARIKEGKLSHQAIAEMETELRKERQDAVAELNAIQSRLILFMKLENDVIEKERNVSADATSKAQELRGLMKRRSGIGTITSSPRSPRFRRLPPRRRWAFPGWPGPMLIFSIFRI